MTSTVTPMRRELSKPTRDDAETRELLARFRPEGFESIQFKAAQFLPYLGDADGFRRDWGDDVTSGATLILFSGLDDAGQARLQATIDLCVALGGVRVVFVHDHPRVSAPRLRDFASLLGAAGRVAQDRGIPLSLHHHSEEPVATPDDIEMFFDALDGAPVGLTLDVGHLVRVGAPLAAAVHRFAGIIDNVHAKDVQGGEWRLLGRGTAEVDDFLAALREVGYTGPFCVDEETDARLDDTFAASRSWLDARQV